MTFGVLRSSLRPAEGSHLTASRVEGIVFEGPAWNLQRRSSSPTSGYIARDMNAKQHGEMGFDSDDRARYYGSSLVGTFSKRVDT